MSYNPSDKNQEILEVAMSYIQSVPYAVSLRWVFYCLLQDGYYSRKEDYIAWKALASAARKKFYMSWNPDTLKDETRSVAIRNGGYYDAIDAKDRYLHDLVRKNPVIIDHFVTQTEVVLICFEARAMTDQFRYYTTRIDLVPFGGDSSIPLKWKVAKLIERNHNRYKKHIRILYFGDYDKKGLQIADSAINDVKKWCDVDFEVTKCGLTLSQASEFKVPENPEKPGEYQWEALSDQAAEIIITNAVDRYVDYRVLSRVGDIEIELTEEFEGKIKSLRED